MIPVKMLSMVHNDTIKIEEVVIRRSKSGSIPGYRTQKLDSATLNDYSQLSLAEVLPGCLNIPVKSYGMGGTTTASFRGTDASHTVVAWNGVNLGNPMLGISDLSLIATGMTDNVVVYYGGASMFMSNGGTGGMINLITNPVWEHSTLASLNTGSGSFGSYSALLKLRTGNRKIQSISKIIFQTAENDFRYLNVYNSIVPEWQTRKHSQINQKGFMQELYLRNNNSVASARVWYQVANRNLPVSMLNQQYGSNEHQYDESLRALFDYKISRNNTTSYVAASMVINKLKYTNQIASIDSRNLSQTYSFKGSAERYLGQGATLKMTVEDSYDVINTTNYNHTASRNTATLSSLVTGTFAGRINGSLLLREIISGKSILVPDFSLGVQFRLSDENEYFLRANLSRSSRLPGMNDLYWLPGGNPGLKNEYAYIYELSYSMDKHLSSRLRMQYDLTVFQNNIKNMIQWHPGDYSFWIADNIRSVRSYGIESVISAVYTGENITAKVKTAYSFTRASNRRNIYNNEAITDKQLIYIPVNKANTTFTLIHRSLYSTWTADFTGKRFITVDNSRYLSSYFINDVSVGIKLKIKSVVLDTGFAVKNLFNVNYQTIAYYPLPGRYYNLKFLIQFTK